MNICIRADASTAIGSGHVMRCLTLAAELRSRGGDILFLCRDLFGSLANHIQREGFKISLLPEQQDRFDWQIDCSAVIQTIIERRVDIDWIIVDSYLLDWHWETALRPFCKKIMVIDDLANRRHECDVLLDQNYYFDKSTRYVNLLPSGCTALLGPQYALLRTEFIEARYSLQPKELSVKRILVFFGGSDPTNETMKALQAFESVDLSDISIDVVVGISNCNQDVIRKMCQSITSYNFHYQVDNMAELMAKSDLAIGAGGSASWERCFLGLPTIGIIVADNQEQLVNDLAAFGAMINLGRSNRVDTVILAESINQLVHDFRLRQSLSHKCFELMAGYRGSRAITALMGDSDV